MGAHLIQITSSRGQVFIIQVRRKKGQMSGTYMDQVYRWSGIRHFRTMSYFSKISRLHIGNSTLQSYNGKHQSTGITSNGKIKFYQSHTNGCSFYGKIWSEGSEEPAENNWVGNMIQPPAPHGYISVTNLVYYLNVGKAVFSSLHAFEKTVKVLKKLYDAIKSGKPNEYIDMLRGKAKISVQESDEVEEQVKEGELEAEEVEPDEEVIPDDIAEVPEPADVPVTTETTEITDDSNPPFHIVIFYLP